MDPATGRQRWATRTVHGSRRNAARELASFVAEVDHRRALRAAVPADRFVFSDAADCAEPWKPNLVTKRFITARRRAGLAHFRLHDLRGFMATEMLAAGVPIATVSQRLCHAAPRPR